METEMSAHRPFLHRRHQTLATATPLTEMSDDSSFLRRRHQATTTPLSTIETEMSDDRPFLRWRYPAATPISTIETEMSDDRPFPRPGATPISTIEADMSGHRSSEGFVSGVSLERSAPSRPSAIRFSTREFSTRKAEPIRFSTKEAERRSKRSLPVLSEGGSSGPAWVILNRVGGRKDCFSGDDITSAVSLTSTGEEISVSFKFVEPPGHPSSPLTGQMGPTP